MKRGIPQADHELNDYVEIFEPSLSSVLVIRSVGPLRDLTSLSYCLLLFVKR
jgi:hypothetical protein